mgnify:FL=1|jgi:putative transposase
MKKRYSEEQIITAIKEHEAGAKVDDICRRLGISSGTFYNWRSTYVYRASPPNDAMLRERLKKLAARHSSYGYLFLHALLKKDKFAVNRKRTYLIYGEEGLQVPRRQGYLSRVEVGN